MQKIRWRRVALSLGAILGTLGLVVMSLATLRAIDVQNELDRRVSTLQEELATWQYFTMRSHELATKQALLLEKQGGPVTSAADHALAPCLAAAATIPPVSSGLPWNPAKVRRAIRERQEWCTNAQQVIASARDCAATEALDEAVESLDRQLAQFAPQ